MALDASLYETIPQTNVAGTIALIHSVLTASKGVQLPAAKKALRRVRDAGEALRTQHQTVPPAKVESVTRAADSAVDRMWSAVANRLAANIELGGADGAEAARIYALLFAKGLTFLTLRYPEQWAEGEAILGRITSEGLEPTLDRLVGAPFLRELRARQAAYGEALGITKVKAATPEPVNLVEPLREARAALGTYVRVLIAAVENGDFDEASAIPMLAPLASLRTSLRDKRKPADSAEPSPVSPEPLPPVE
ncbi:MAG: hypothetical protein BGO98_04465 [Myxococcales bacterium 68-20]|nr:MAG: hypothetical protein BGO98_04465 [Myxococcales bacterium 68-20]